MSTIDCPICKKLVPRDGGSYPFCSERCRLVDLGNWLGEGYRVPGEPSSEPPTSEDERGGGAGGAKRSPDDSG